jgi:hypothetical protein
MALQSSKRTRSATSPKWLCTKKFDATYGMIYWNLAATRVNSLEALYEVSDDQKEVNLLFCSWTPPMIDGWPLLKLEDLKLRHTEGTYSTSDLQSIDITAKPNHLDIECNDSDGNISHLL